MNILVAMTIIIIEETLILIKLLTSIYYLLLAL